MQQAFRGKTDGARFAATGRNARHDCYPWCETRTIVAGLAMRIEVDRAGYPLSAQSDSKLHGRARVSDRYAPEQRAPLLRGVTGTAGFRRFRWSHLDRILIAQLPNARIAAPDRNGARV
jgi:hypothetical protein